MEQIPIDDPAFKGMNVAYEPGKLFGNEYIVVDGEKHPFKNGKCTVKNKKGKDVDVRIKLKGIIPKIVIEGRLHDAGDEIEIHEYLWTMLPILITFIGGALGFIIGFSACIINTNVFRRFRHTKMKYLYTLGITLFALGIYFGAAALT